MGCASSKVGQKPPEQSTVHEVHASEKGQGETREESRPALPVVEPMETKCLAASKKGEKGRGHLVLEQAHIEERRPVAAGEEEKGGETVTDASGLQMRTPRTCAEPGLHFAARNGDLSLVHMLLGNSIGNGSLAPVVSGENGVECEGKSVPEGALPGAKMADLDERGMWGNTPLLVATQYAHPQIALALVAGGADVCLENERRATALHFSCAEGSVDVSLALLNSGANVDPAVAAVHHPGVNGGQTIPLTPLSAAATGGHTELVRLLVQHGAEVDRRVSPVGTDGQERKSSFSGTDGIGGSALTAAARYGHSETCLLLIDSGASISLQDWDSRTPLLHAILEGHEETAMALLDGARSVGCVNKVVMAHESETGDAEGSGLTSLQAACGKGLQTVVKALIAAGAKVESRDATGASALLHACRKGRLECARELLSKGADPLARDSKGNTPLSAARCRWEQPRGEELQNLVEAAVADAESREGLLDTSRSRDAAEADNPADNIINSKNNKVDEENNGAGDGLTDKSRRGQDGNEDEDVLLVSDWDPESEGMLDNYDAAAVHTDQSKLDAAESLPKNAVVETGNNEDEDVLLVGEYDSEMEEGRISEVLLPAEEREETAGSQELVQPSGLVPNILVRLSREHHVAPQELVEKLVTLQVAGESVDWAMTVAADNVVLARPAEGA